MSHIKVYLDDVRDCPEGWIVARSVWEAIRLIENHPGTFDISLDHDLGEIDGMESPSGCDMIRWLMDNARYPECATIHSANPVGRKNLQFDLAFMRRIQGSV